MAMATLKTTNLRNRIDDTKKRIAKLFIDQCQNGAQTKCLESYKAAACGQFIGGNAKNSKQRGLHGTAAALRVLAETDSADSRTLIPKIITYLEKREEIEVSLQKEKARQKCNLDEKNTIKISEVLYALSLVGHGIQSTEPLVQKIAERLIQSMKERKGWSYFVDDVDPPQLLPTAYAILGLSANGYPQAEGASEYLAEVLKGRYVEKKTDRNEIDADVIVDVACLYAITFAKVHIQNDFLKTVLKSIWQKLKPLLGEPLEQNIEYSYKRQQNCYVRVPWQLYLIALSTHYDFNWAFSSSTVQKTLKNILDKAQYAGLIYPHSGKMTSARTNAILFEVLSILEDKLAHKNIFWLCEVKEAIIGFFRHKYTRRVSGVLFLVLTVIVVLKWCLGTGKVTDLGQEIVGAIWVGLLLTSLKK